MGYLLETLMPHWQRVCKVYKRHRNAFRKILIRYDLPCIRKDEGGAGRGCGQKKRGSALDDAPLKRLAGDGASGVAGGNVGRGQPHPPRPVRARRPSDGRYEVFNRTCRGVLEATTGIEPVYTDLQSAA
jgi:hypothetical protein